MLEMREKDIAKDIILHLGDCDKTMSKDGKDGKDDIANLAAKTCWGSFLAIAQ